MQEISLSSGQVALVDDEDWPLLDQWKWSAKFNITNKSYYAHRVENGRIIYMHRFIMGFPRDMQVDHLNHNTLDNRKENLRICTCRENSLNRINKSNTKIPNITLIKRTYGIYYVVQVCVRGSKTYVGCFKDINDAIRARDEFIKVNNVT